MDSNFCSMINSLASPNFLAGRGMNKNDGHAGDWGRQITCLNWASVKNVNKEHNMNIGPGDFAENVKTSRESNNSLGINLYLPIKQVFVAGSG